MQVQRWAAVVRLLLLLPLHHGEGDLFAVSVDLLDPHLHRVADTHHVAGVLDEAVGQLGDVYEAVLVHAHVDKGAKVHNVAHCTLEFHAGLQIVDGKCRAAKDHLGCVVARVAAGLLELVDDVDEREGAAVQVACQRRDAAQTALDAANAKLSECQAKAQETAVRKAEAQTARDAAKAKLDQASEAYADATASVKDLTAKRDAARTDLESKKSAFNDAKKADDAAQAEVDDAQAAQTAAATALSDAQQEVANKEQALTDAQAKVTAAQTALDAANAAFQRYAAAQKAVDDAKAAYDAAVAGVDDA